MANTQQSKAEIRKLMLTPEQKRQLDAKAARRGISRSALIAEIAERLVAGQVKPAAPADLVRVTYSMDPNLAQRAAMAAARNGVSFGEVVRQEATRD